MAEIFGVDGAAPGRLAVVHYAAPAGDVNGRAMVGSRILAQALSEQLKVPAVQVGHPRPLRGGEWEQELFSATDDLEALADQYRGVLQRGQVPVTALGRCAAALATLPVIAGLRPGAAIVWFDAHADLNTPDSSLTGYLGGMALAGPLGLWISGMGDGLDLERVILVGTRDIDPAEQRVIDEIGIPVLAPGPGLRERLREAVGSRDVFVHLDCDVLEPGILPTGYQVPNGLSLDDLEGACDVLAESFVVGLEIAELELDDDSVDLAPLLAALAPLVQRATESDDLGGHR